MRFRALFGTGTSSRRPHEAPSLILTRRLGLALGRLVALAGLTLPSHSATQVGYQAQSYDGYGAESAGGATTGQKPESTLWSQDGGWWGAMCSPTARGAPPVY